MIRGAALFDLRTLSVGNVSRYATSFYIFDPISPCNTVASDCCRIICMWIDHLCHNMVPLMDICLVREYESHFLLLPGKLGRVFVHVTAYGLKMGR